MLAYKTKTCRLKNMLQLWKVRKFIFTRNQLVLFFCDLPDLIIVQQFSENGGQIDY